jgi:hypothetical protein
MTIRNTSKAIQDPAEKLLILGASMGPDGLSGAIEQQERAGQRELVNSDRLPADCGDHAPWLALGFTFGDPDPSDPLFMPAALPPGWQRKTTDHAMGSVIIDTLGRQRVSIFYKAAFYDRHAHMYLIGLSEYVQAAVEYEGDPVIFDDEWATEEAALAAMAELRDQKREEAGKFRAYAADKDRRDPGNRADCARIAGQREAAAALYDAAITKLSDGQ